MFTERLHKYNYSPELCTVHNIVKCRHAPVSYESSFYYFVEECGRGGVCVREGGRESWWRVERGHKYLTHSKVEGKC